MKQKNIEAQFNAILPNRVQAPSMNAPDASSPEAIAKEAASVKAKADAKELARIKYVEKCRLKREKAKVEKKQSLADDLGLTPTEALDLSTESQVWKAAEQKKRVEAIEAIEAQTVTPLDPAELSERKGTYSASTTGQLLQLQGSSRPEIVKLLTSLNINLSVQLTKQDTANLLACLLTCNESQLQALVSNKKIPVVIKTVIKRLIEDMKLGNIETVEKLWDRVFGKGQMQLNLPEQQQLRMGILPDVPVSREAYIVIREALLK